MDKKSQENLDSAELLITHGKYTASIHCSYYAVFQYMKYALNSFTISLKNPNISYKEQNKLKRCKAPNKNKKSHIVITNEVVKRLAEVCPTTAHEFSQKIEDLKDHRNIADYQINFLKKKKSKKDLDLAKSLISTLKSKFILP